MKVKRTFEIEINTQLTDEEWSKVVYLAGQARNVDYKSHKLWPDQLHITCKTEANAYRASVWLSERGFSHKIATLTETQFLGRNDRIYGGRNDLTK